MFPLDMFPLVLLKNGNFPLRFKIRITTKIAAIAIKPIIIPTTVPVLDDDDDAVAVDSMIFFGFDRLQT
jgi:hypothetical protein